MVLTPADVVGITGGVRREDVGWKDTVLLRAAVALGEETSRPDCVVEGEDVPSAAVVPDGMPGFESVNRALETFASGTLS